MKAISNRRTRACKRGCDMRDDVSNVSLSAPAKAKHGRKTDHFAIDVSRIQSPQEPSSLRFKTHCGGGKVESHRRA
jgi:hypothetical protein